MIRRILAKIFLRNRLNPVPCPKCSGPSFDGVCPGCFQAGEELWVN